MVASGSAMKMEPSLWLIAVIHTANVWMESGRPGITRRRSWIQLGRSDLAHEAFSNHRSRDEWN